MADTFPPDAALPSPGEGPDQPTLIETRAERQAGEGPDLGATTSSRGFEVHPTAEDVGNGPLSRLAEYELLAEIGRGGMGVVFKARHLRLNRVVALKMILGGALAGPDDLQRFETEAAAAAQLQHPGIVGLYEIGSHEGQPYFSMEFVSGSSLAQRVLRGPLPGRQAAAYLEQTARAVHYAHGRGILHRDLKPANVLLDDNDLPKVTDFGLAKLLQTDSGQTRTGAVLGTPSYMAPEQAAARKDLGPACDVYSLGAILYELLTARPPFRGESALSTLKMVVDAEPLAPRLLNPKVDVDLETICLKCLDKDPARRYASAGALAEDLQRFQSGEPIQARRLGVLGRAVKWARRKPTAAALLAVSAAALLALVGGVLAFGMWQAQVARDERALRQEAQEAQRLAVVRENAMRHLFYLAQMRQAEQAWEAADLDRTEKLLAHWEPRPDYSDLRGWEWYYLRALRQGKFLLPGHAGRATAVAFAPDGTRLASAGGEPGRQGDVKIWDLATGRPLLTLTGHANAVTGVAFRPGGKYLATCSHDRTVKLWDALTGREVCTLAGHSAHVAGVAFNPDGQRLASAGGDHTVRIWDIGHLVDGLPLPPPLVLQGHTSDVAAVAFHPDGATLASASRDGTVKLWEGATGKEQRTLSGHVGEVVSLAYSKTGRVLATAGGSGSRSGEILLWDTCDGKLLLSREHLADKILTVTFSRDNKLAAAGSDGMIRIWDRATSGEALRFRGDAQLVYGVAFSPDGRRLASVGRDGRIRLWNSNGRQDTAGLAVAVPAEQVAFRADGRQLACASRAGPVVLLDVDTGAVQRTLPATPGPVHCVAYIGDGTRLATGCEDQAVRIYDLAHPAEPLVLVGHTGRVTALAVNPLGTLAASAGEDEGVRLWNLETGRLERVLQGHRNGVLAVAFSPDGRHVASGSFDKTIRVWDVTSNEVVVLAGHSGSVNAVAFSPDGRRLASGSSDRTVRIWDLAARREVARLEGAAGPVTSLAYHPGGQRLANVGQDHSVRLWDLVTRQEILELEGVTASCAV